LLYVKIPDGIGFAFPFPVKDESIRNLQDPIAQSFVKSICPLVPTWGIQMKLDCPWEILFYTETSKFTLIETG